MMKEETFSIAFALNVRTQRKRVFSTTRGERKVGNRDGTPRSVADRRSAAVCSVAAATLATLAANCSPSPRLLLNDRAEFYPVA